MIKMSNNSITSALIRQSRMKYLSRLSTKLYDVNSPSRLKKTKKRKSKEQVHLLDESVGSCHNLK